MDHSLTWLISLRVLEFLFSNWHHFWCPHGQSWAFGIPAAWHFKLSILKAVPRWWYYSFRNQCSLVLHGWSFLCFQTDDRCSWIYGGVMSPKTQCKMKISYLEKKICLVYLVNCTSLLCLASLKHSQSTFARQQLGRITWHRTCIIMKSYSIDCWTESHVLTYAMWGSICIL
jgi:hypothetical protein